MDGCILAATDGGAGSLGALRCARDLGRSMGLEVEIASACEASNESESGAAGFFRSGAPSGWEPVCVRRRDAVRELLPEGMPFTVPVHVEVGAAGTVIGRLAAERRAELIVLGRGSHTPVHRLMGEETAPRLMHSAHAPVLSVPEDYAGLPTRALVAIDFTSHSLDASCVVTRLLPAGAELHLVHVASLESGVALPSPSAVEWVRAMGQEVESRMQELVRQLVRAAPHVKVVPHVTHGRPASAILALAEETDAEIVAAGTSGYGFLGRLLMGSVATQLVRRTRRMTLIAPPRDVVPRCPVRLDRLFVAEAIG